MQVAWLHVLLHSTRVYVGETRAADIFVAEGREYTDNHVLAVSFGGSAGHLCPRGG